MELEIKALATHLCVFRMEKEMDMEMEIHLDSEDGNMLLGEEEGDKANNSPLPPPPKLPQNENGEEGDSASAFKVPPPPPPKPKKAVNTATTIPSVNQPNGIQLGEGFASANLNISNNSTGEMKKPRKRGGRWSKARIAAAIARTTKQQDQDGNGNVELVPYLPPGPSSMKEPAQLQTPPNALNEIAPGASATTTTTTASAPAAVNGVKRKMENRSPQTPSPVNRKKTSGNTEKEDTYREIVVITKVMITKRDPTAGLMTATDRADFGSALELEMMKAESAPDLKIREIRLEDGKVAVLCCNSASVDFVKNAAETLLEGIYKGWEVRDMPEEFQRKAFFAFLEGAKPTNEDLIKALAKFNPALHCEQWSVSGSNPGYFGEGERKKIGTWLTFTMPIGLLPALERANYQAFFTCRFMSRLRESKPKAKKEATSATIEEVVLE